MTPPFYVGTVSVTSCHYFESPSLTLVRGSPPRSDKGRKRVPGVYPAGSARAARSVLSIVVATTARGIPSENSLIGSYAMGASSIITTNRLRRFVPFGQFVVVLDWRTHRLENSPWYSGVST